MLGSHKTEPDENYPNVILLGSVQSEANAGFG